MKSIAPVVARPLCGHDRCGARTGQQGAIASRQSQTAGRGASRRRKAAGRHIHWIYQRRQGVCKSHIRQRETVADEVPATVCQARIHALDHCSNLPECLLRDTGREVQRQAQETREQRVGPTHRKDFVVRRPFRQGRIMVRRCGRRWK